MSILGSCAEIIAGLYGITLAGYTFFLSRMDALMAADATLDYVVSNIKSRFKYLIWHITFNVTMTLFISIALMYIPVPESAAHSFVYRLICNEFVLFLGSSISLILFYSLLVIDPNCIQKEAAMQKQKLSKPNGKEGSVVEFLVCFDQIEKRCNQMLPVPVIQQIRTHKGNHFVYTIVLLQKQLLISDEAATRLTRIHQYYECVLNSEAMDVTQEMCVFAQEMLADLNVDSGNRRKRKEVTEPS